MSGQPQNANLSACGSELLRCIEELKKKRDDLARNIQAEAEEKEKIQRGIATLTEKLQKITVNQERNMQARDEYEKTIQETEAAYIKIIESSQTLLHVLRRESLNLAKKAGP
ncbi:Sjoegren syndrome nuclear autoantigen 1, related [Eimeria praecox]|uniref:Sjoegren syndrome nuclear autoantigen 1, related n=1 Tax=Eimeria praecox TaxID=51316 RepID=U6G6K6_9EIME|nr:Sjoegren syndrome nuclear autoantigen 1, related [Eimeria praecox]